MSLPSSRYSVPALVGLAAMVSLSFPTPALAADAGSGARPPAIMRVASENLSATPAAGRPAVASAYPAVKPLAPRTATARPSHEVFGFAQAGGLGGGTGVGWNTWDYSLLTTVAYFGVHVAGDGTIITGDTGYSTWRGADVTNMINAAHAAGARAVLTLVCQDYQGSACGSGGYCAALQNQATTITQAVNEMTSRGVDGINVDYEGYSQTCPGGQSTRTLLRSLVQGLRARAPGMHLTVDTYASSAGDPAGPIDVPGMAGAVNGFFVMAYELDNSNWGAPPLSCSRYCFSPTSPLSGYGWTDERVAREYSAAAGPGKTILGLPYYGYAACVQSLTENAYPYPTGGTPPPRWSVPTEVSAQGLAGSVSGYSPHRDSHNGADFWATYYSPDYACNRELYLDDAYSLGRKYDLVLAYGLGGAGMWSLDYGGGIGSLWDAIATHFTTRPAAPTGVTACGAAASAYVSWTPGSGGGAVASYTVTASPGGATVTAPAGQTGVTFPGLSAGTSYSFTVTATNGSGPSAFSASSGSVTPAASAKTAYFTWFDRASPGMLNDNIHLVNPGPGDDGGCVYVSGVAVQPFGLAAGATTYVAFPGQIGGPVLVTTTSGSAVAAQRVQYNGSFNEVPAATSPQSTLWFPWYDHASSGMVADNIHVVNPGSAPATVRIAGPGTPGSITVQPGAEGIFSWPQGVLGGPVSLSTDPATPVIASQRVQYYGTFNETLARGSQDAGQDLVFNWYDHASPGMWNDNVHLVNPQTNDITVSLSAAGASAKVSVPALGGTFVNLGNVIGGPLWVHSDGGKVIASQRVQYYGSFNEAGGTPTSAAAASIWMPWYDAASPGMFADNVHVLNPNGTPVTALVQAPGGPKTVQLQPYGEGYVNWPGTIGGPVHVTSTGGNVIASQRVQYYQTFNEAGGLVA